MMIIIAAFIFIVGIALLVFSLKAARDASAVNNNIDSDRFMRIGIGGCVIFTLVAISFLYAVPIYKVWQKGKDGEAALAEATANRQILIQEATAKEEAAKHLAEAEVIAANARATSNKIIGTSVQHNPLILQYLYIDSLKESKNKVIYVPVGSNGLPLLESARLLDDGVVTYNLHKEEDK